MYEEHHKTNKLYLHIFATLKKRFKKTGLFLRKLIISEGDYVYDKTDANYSRQSLSIAMSLFIICACGPLFVFGSLLYLKQGNYIFSALEFLSYVFLVGIILIKKINIGIRKFIVMLFLFFFSIFILVTTAINGAGMICVLAIMFLSGILLEGKKLYSFVVIDVLVFIVLTVLLVSGTFDGTIMESFKDIWFINMLTTQICAIGLLFLTHIIYKTLEKQAKSIKVSKDLIQKSEKKYRSTFTYAGLGIFNLSLEENITNANIKCCETLGYSIYELKKLIFKEIIFIGDVDIFEEMLSKAKNKEGKHSNSEIRCNQKNGEIIWANITIVYVENTTNKSMSFICTIEDITGKKNLAKKNLSLELHLRGQQRLESIGTLASGIAHEINNPINGILNYGQIILDTDSIETDIKEYAGEIIHESNRISEIVKNLLSFSRQSNQAHSYANIEDIISQTMSLIKAVMRHDQIELTISIDEDLPQIKCRSQQLQQVIMNLLTNAQDALNEKYPEYDENKIINISCTNINLSGRNWLKLTIEDFGCGIPKSILQKIFDPFFTTKGKDKGTGLGLSISYGIIKEHHGEMTVETEENEYTRFILRLPCDNGWTLNK